MFDMGMEDEGGVRCYSVWVRVDPEQPLSEMLMSYNIFQACLNHCQTHCYVVMPELCK